MCEDNFIIFGLFIELIIGYWVVIEFIGVDKVFVGCETTPQ